MTILNLTQHPATAEQKAAGVVDLPDDRAWQIRLCLTFDNPPSPATIRQRAIDITTLALFNNLGGDDGDDPHPLRAMIGGAGYLMPALEKCLREHGIEPLHAFTRREVVERTEPDGAVTKSAVFRHAGFVSTSLTT